MFKNSLDSILSEFTKLDSKLEKFISFSESEGNIISDNIVAMTDKLNTIIVERSRATNIRGNIKKLLGE